MKRFFFLLSLVSSLPAFSQQKLERIWETDTVLAIPESVLPSPKNKTLYVSLIDGPSWEMDGKGGVGRLHPDGKIFEPAWITGLSAPKGMGIINDRLYVADMNQVVVVDALRGSIEKKIVIDSAKGLNDIAINEAGIVFVSDSRGHRIWKLQNDVPTIFLDSVRNVNGLKAIGTDLYIGAGKFFKKLDASGKLVTLAEVPQGIDGIEPVGNGDFLLTAWGGWVWYVHADGKVETLLETHAEKKNTADIGYDAEQRIVYVPTFNAKTVVAYRLK